MDWATEIAAKVQANLEGGPYTADDVERIAAVLRAEREACAKIADGYADAFGSQDERDVLMARTGQLIADAIRERK